MKQIKKNIIDSFGLVKKDILYLQREMAILRETQKEILDSLKRLSIKQSEKNISGNKTTKPDKVYLASKTGKKFHVPSCPFAKNIKPKQKVSFKSTTKALNEGYKPCACIN